jgi:AAA domain
MTLRLRPVKAKIIEHNRPTAAFSRERILNYGKEGTGKTNAWLSIAEAYPDVPFFCMDTDDSVQRLLETDFTELQNITTRVVQTWEDFDLAATEFLRKADEYVSNVDITRKEDYPWVIVDFSDATWDMVQNYFTEQVFDQGVAEFFLHARKQMRGKAGQLQPLEGWTDWQVINKVYQTRWTALTKGGGPYHLYITSGSKEISGMENRSLYKSLKRMPTGEKRMPHRVHTVLMSSVDKDGWYLSSAKDRGRELLDDKKMPNFAISYLMKVAGWER